MPSVGFDDVSWPWQKQPPVVEPPIARRYLSGRTFHAELKGRIEISAMEAKGWIMLHTEAGPIMLKDQIIDCDSGEL